MPKISLALPVYNGEKHIETCITSILAQTFADFELVISDNASSDRTPEILERFAAEDSRIRVIRQRENVGAARNFNLLLDETTADMFKWCAHDDRLEPNFLEETYAELMTAPDAVLCHSHTVIHDMDRDETETFVPQFTMPADDRVARLREVFLHGQRCYEVFGLIRRGALERTHLIGNYRGGDNVLLYRLALLGTFEIVPKPLFILGRHQEQSTALVKDSHAYQAWFAGNKKKISYPDWKYLAETWRITRNLKLSPRERARCRQELLKETYRRRARLRRDLRIAIETLIFGESDPERRRRLFKPSSN